MFMMLEQKVMQHILLATLTNTTESVIALLEKMNISYTFKQGLKDKMYCMTHVAQKRLANSILPQDLVDSTLFCLVYLILSGLER